MSNLNCDNGIITKDLALHIDISDDKSWDLNTGLTVVSLTKWKNAISSDLNLPDYGLTGYDNGNVDSMLDSLTIGANDTKVKLYRIGYNNHTGGTFYDGYDITPITSGNTGNYFDLDGGYLNGFFKLKDYNYQLLPYRYLNGITIELIVKIEERSFDGGNLLLIGSRAEDKYIQEFSGETKIVDGNFEGVRTSLGNYLASFNTETQVNNAVTNNQLYKEVFVENAPDDVFDNIFSLSLESDGKLSFNSINVDGSFVKKESENSITTGWTFISIVFKPYSEIKDKDLIDCTENRLGDFIVYVNGRKFWKIESFEEFWFKGFENDKEKQIGVPYNISFGGGSYGLKHSYHWDYKTYPLYVSGSTSGFSETYIRDTCKTLAEQEAEFDPTLLISSDNTSFGEYDVCEPSIINYKTVLKVNQNSGYTSGQTKNQYLIKYNSPIELISNRDYVFEMEVFDDGSLYSINSVLRDISMQFTSDVDIEILDEVIYSNTLTNQWQKLTTKLRIKENSGVHNINFAILISSDLPLLPNFNLYFDSIMYTGQDILNKDATKDNQLVEKYFSNSFKGGIQKLRIYDRYLNQVDILNNAIFESKNNLGYGLVISKGGRIINL